MKEIVLEKNESLKIISGNEEINITSSNFFVISYQPINGTQKSILIKPIAANCISVMLEGLNE